MYTSRLPFSSIQNDFLRLDYLKTTGPRVVGLFVQGIDGNLLAETPEAHWETPHGEYYLHGGHRLWTAPEDPYYTCPEDGLEVVEEHGTVILRSPVDAAGLQKEITIDLEENHVRVSHRVTWYGERPVRMAPWAITQFQLGGRAVLPLSKAKGLQPNRNLVFWPYSDLKDERLELSDDEIAIHAYGTGRAFKVGSFNSSGWSAYRYGKVTLIKTFAVDGFESLPDMGCNTQVYVNDSCIELETLGAARLLNTGQSLELNEAWQVHVGNHAPILESVHHSVGDYS
jgi:hypothetical protein